MTKSSRIINPIYIRMKDICSIYCTNNKKKARLSGGGEGEEAGWLDSGHWIQKKMYGLTNNQWPVINEKP